MAGHARINRIERRLVPDVSKTLTLPLFFDFFGCVVSAVSIEKENPVTGQAVINRAKIIQQVCPLEKQEIAEIHGEDYVCRFGLCFEHILLQ